MDLQVISLIATLLSGLVTMFVGVLINRGDARNKRIEEDIKTCVTDTKDCNKSIATLATKIAISDTKLGTIDMDLHTMAGKIYELTSAVSELRTRDQISRGHD